jgi:hypothetical protein
MPLSYLEMYDVSGKLQASPSHPKSRQRGSFYIFNTTDTVSSSNLFITLSRCFTRRLVRDQQIHFFFPSP